MDGDRNESEEEENDVSQSSFPIGRYGDSNQLASNYVHFMSNANENKRRCQDVEDRVVWYKDEDAVCISCQPNVILPCN
jgi:hypothetical protein